MQILLILQALPFYYANRQPITPQTQPPTYKTRRRPDPRTPIEPTKLTALEEGTPFGGGGGDELGVSVTAGVKAEGGGDVGLISGGLEGGGDVGLISGGLEGGLISGGLEGGEVKGEGEVALVVEFDIGVGVLLAMTMTIKLSFLRQFCSFPLMK